MAWLGFVEDVVALRRGKGELAHPRHEKGSLGFAEVTVTGEIVSGKSGDSVELAGCDHAQLAWREA